MLGLSSSQKSHKIVITSNVQFVSQTAEAAIKALTDKAATWSDNLVKESPEVKSDWQNLKLKLQYRFGKIKSLSDRVRIVLSLNQRAKESSEDFFDRVSARLYDVEQEVLDSAEGDSERRAMIR